MTESIILSSILLGTSIFLFFYTAEKLTLGKTKKVALSVYAIFAIGSLINIFLKAFGI